VNPGLQALLGGLKKLNFLPFPSFNGKKEKKIWFFFKPAASVPFPGLRVKVSYSSTEGWCFIDDSATPKRAASQSSTYAKHRNFLVGSFQGPYGGLRTRDRINAVLFPQTTHISGRADSMGFIGLIRDDNSPRTATWRPPRIYDVAALWRGHVQEY
jgi:hypothetical protein